MSKLSVWVSLAFLVGCSNPDNSVKSGNMVGVDGSVEQTDDGGVGPKKDGGKQVEAGAVGAPCMENSDCEGGADAVCITDANGWPQGYCGIENCSEGTCPAGSECFTLQDESTICLATCSEKSDCRDSYMCHQAGACVPGCSTNADCSEGEECNADTGSCVVPPCTENSCPEGQMCVNEVCVVDIGPGPGMGPGPACPNLPQQICTGTGCSTLEQFSPDEGPGYDDYNINGETEANQYRSFSRRDVQDLVKHAAAWVDCKAAAWTPGNKKPIGLGDMSEGNGAIPGTSIGEPGHPEGTHENGLDMDIAYFQLTSPDNKLREVCPHEEGGQDAYHCTGAPNNIDIWRTAMFIGSFFSSNKMRVIGVDGKIGQMVISAMNTLCSNGWFPQSVCDTTEDGLAYEVQDMGWGWYYFHHHHLHISYDAPSPPPPPPPGFGPAPSTASFLSRKLSPFGANLNASLRKILETGAYGEALVSNGPRRIKLRGHKPF